MAPSNKQNEIVKAVGLTKIFNDFWGRPKAKAVNGVDFTVKAGQVFGLLGPNGSGKSTTVKMLLGLLYPTRGKLEVLGESPNSVAAKRRIGYLPEETYLYKYLTAAETLDFFGSLFGISEKERADRCDQLLEMVGLEAARNRSVGEFSKGMARRIGLAQALINDPDLVILDEPTSGLDPIGCRDVKDLIKLLSSRGKTVILCSHLLADVEDICDYIVVYYGGKIRAQGSVKDVLTVEDKTRITVPRLEKPELEKVLTSLRTAIGSDDEFHVDQPSMNLEEFFLDVVRKAKDEGIVSSGAQAGGETAEFLKTGEHGDSPAAILKSLAVKEELEHAKREETQSRKKEELKRKAADAKISKLVAEEPSEEQETEIPSGKLDATADESLRKASEKLKDLLGPKD